MTESRRLLQHFLASLAYRTQKSLRGALPDFDMFRAGPNVRTPHELMWHMTGLIGYARTMLHGGEFAPPRTPRFEDEVVRFHRILEAFRQDLEDPNLTARISDQQLLHGPLSDAMTHVGQIALLRRLAGSPVPPENFISADIRIDNLSEVQPLPRSPALIGMPSNPRSHLGRSAGAPPRIRGPERIPRRRV